MPGFPIAYFFLNLILLVCLTCSGLSPVRFFLESDCGHGIGLWIGSDFCLETDLFLEIDFDLGFCS